MQKAMPTPAAMIPWISSQDATVAASASRASPTKVTLIPTIARRRGFKRRMMNRNNISTSSSPWTRAVQPI